MAFAPAFESPGRYELAIENVSAGMLVVSETGAANDTSGDEATDSATGAGSDAEKGDEEKGDGAADEKKSDGATSGGKKGDRATGGDAGSTGRNANGFDLDFGAGGLYFASFLLALLAAMLWRYLLS